MGVVLAVIVCTCARYLLRDATTSRCGMAPSLAVLITYRRFVLSAECGAADQVIPTRRPLPRSLPAGAPACSAVQMQISSDARCHRGVRCHHGRSDAVHRQNKGQHNDTCSFTNRGAAKLMSIRVSGHFHHLCVGSGSCRYRGRAAVLRVLTRAGHSSLPSIKAFTAAVFGGISSNSGRVHRRHSQPASSRFLPERTHISTQLSDASCSQCSPSRECCWSAGRLLGKHVSERFKGAVI